MALQLRQYDPGDGEQIVSWIKSERVLRQWSATGFASFPITAEELDRKHLANKAACSQTQSYYPMTAVDAGAVVGHLFLRYSAGEEKTARLGYVIVDDSKRGMGYGKQMLKLAMEYACSCLGAQTITLGVFENNPRAYRCYCGLGFSENGKASFCEIDGNEWRIIEMQWQKL